MVIIWDINIKQPETKVIFCMKKKRRYFNIVTGETYECHIDSNESQDEQQLDNFLNIVLIGGTTTSAYCTYYGIANFDSNRDYKMMGTRQGHGYFAEAVAVENNRGWMQAPLNRKSKEPDLFNKEGQPMQVKCCATAQNSVEDLFKHGEYKYGIQDVVVPEEQVDEVKQRLGNKGVSRKVKPIAKGMSYEKIKNCTVKGKASCLYDAKIAMQNAAFPFLAGGVFISSYAYFYSYEKSKSKKEERKPSFIKPILKALGVTFGATTVYVGGSVLKGQIKRRV